MNKMEGVYSDPKQMDMDAADSDDDVILCENYELIEVNDSDEESGSASDPPPAAKPSDHLPKQANNHGNVGVKRIPTYKHTVELLCKHFGVEFKPEWSLQHIRQIFKERTYMHKKPFIIQHAMAHHPLYRRLVITFLPDWFQIYHIITLIRLMSSFDVNQPTYSVQVTRAGKQLREEDPENPMKCLIDFIHIEDCRQLLYDMQGLQCFKNKIQVDLDIGAIHQNIKKCRIEKALKCIKRFRLDQQNWCPNADGITEIDDSENDSCTSYYFPQLADLKKIFKAEKQIYKKQQLAAGKHQKQQLGAVKKQKQLSAAEKNENKSSGTEHKNCRTVVMDKIPHTWEKPHILKLINHIFGRKMEFKSIVLNKNKDKTCKHLVKFASHTDALKVCKALNRFYVSNKRLLVRFESGKDFDDKLSSLASELVPGGSHGDSQPQPINHRPALLPTPSPAVKEIFALMQVPLPRPPILPQPRIDHNFQNFQNFVPQNPHYVLPNSYHPNPYYNNQNWNTNLNTNTPQNQKLPRNNNNTTEVGQMKLENAKRAQIIDKPKEESVVKREKLPKASDSQAQVQLQPIKQEIKEEIVIKNEPSYAS